MLSLSFAEFVMLALAPLLMVVVSLFERRWGPVVAGIVAAAPLTALIGLLLVHADLGAGAGYEMALRMSGYVPAQIGIALAVVSVVHRTGFVPALSVGVITYGCLASISARLPLAVAIGASAVLLVLGPRLVSAPSRADEPTSALRTTGSWMIALRASVSLVTAVGLLVVANQFGPAAAGAVGAFPIFTFTLCCFIYAAAGATGITLVLQGMIRGLVPYFVFVLTFGIVGPSSALSKRPSLQPWSAPAAT